MFYLIMVGSSLIFLLTCLIFCFVPIFKIDKYPISYLVGDSAHYKYSILDILDQPEALVSFILAILSLILVLILLVKAFKIFDGGKYTCSMGDYVFSTVTTICLLLFTIFVFLLFTSHSEVSAEEGLYVYYKKHLSTFILLVIFSAVALVLNIVAFLIKTINKFVPSLSEKKFFKMSSGKAKELKEDTKTTSDKDLSLGNIEVLEKLYQLKEKGIITEEEFNERKSKLL